jgi:hypothetical protein
MAQTSRTIFSKGISGAALSKGVLGAAAVMLTFGAVQFASGRDLSSVSQEPVTSAVDGINRATKTDRATVVGSSAQTQTVSVRLNGLSDTSVLIRMPVAQAARPASPPSFKNLGERKVACEPVVSVLTEVAKQLQPGRCVT